MRIGFVTLFPEMVQAALQHGVLARAAQSGLVEFRCANPRDWAEDAHRKVDDHSAGGGPGMVMMAPLALQAARSLASTDDPVYLAADAAGRPFTQQVAEQLAGEREVIILCGRYEGVDERVLEILGAEPVSIGDFVLTGGELPALAIADAVARLLPGALGDPASHQDDSHSNDGLLGFPLYTKPNEVEGHPIPPVLLEGNHGKIADWRRTQQLLRTKDRRPDLLAKASLTPRDLKLIQAAESPNESGESGS